MKKILVCFLSVFVLGMILNCSHLQVKNIHIQREWMLVSFDNFTKDELIKNKAGIDLTGKNKNGKIKGVAFIGCNKIFFTSQFKNNRKVKISRVGSTMMACQNMDPENLFMKSFGKMTKYSIEGHFLTLSDEDENITMKFVAKDWD